MIIGLQKRYIFIKSLVNLLLLVIRNSTRMLSRILLYYLVRPSIRSRLRFLIPSFDFDFVHEPLEFNIHFNLLPIL